MDRLGGVFPVKTVDSRLLEVYPEVTQSLREIQVVQMKVVLIQVRKQLRNSIIPKWMSSFRLERVWNSQFVKTYHHHIMNDHLLKIL